MSLLDIINSILNTLLLETPNFCFIERRLTHQLYFYSGFNNITVQQKKFQSLSSSARKHSNPDAFVLPVMTQ